MIEKVENDHLALLRETRRRPNVVLHRFVLAYDETKNEVYVFFEGDDDRDYYLPVISIRFGDGVQIKTFICDGKKGVLKVLADIRQRDVKRERTLFLVDKDHDDFLGIDPPDGDEIYVTGYYSIENYIVTEDVVKWLLWRKFRLDHDDPLVQEIVGDFNAAYRTFVKDIQPVMAWVVLMRRKGAPVMLENAKMGSYVKFDDGGRLKRCKGAFYQFRRDVCSRSPRYSADDKRLVLSELKACEPKSYVRGKYEAWLLVKFIESLNKRYRGRQRADGKPFRMLGEFGLKGIFQHFSTEVIYPPEFLEFVRRATLRFAV